MFKKKCRCGKSEKSFKMDIGEFYIDECCMEAGFNHLGEKEEDVDADQGDGDGDIDTEDVKLAVDYEKMGQKELMAECDKKGLKYKSNESKAKLREMLQA